MSAWGRAMGFVALFVLVLGVWMMLPIIPAWLTYRITPDQKIGARGPLSELTVRTTGAFAAYLIVLLVAVPFINQAVRIIVEARTADLRPSWQIKGRLIVQDSQGKEINPRTAEIRVEFKPELVTVAGTGFTLRVPYDRPDWPDVSFQILNFGGSEVINLADWDPDLEIDPIRRQAVVRKPVVIRPVPANLGIIPKP
jgi:hypothetical protein